ncbi:glucosamine inositolphosphorylceramide transferase family protein [Escherichia albertii]|uniref:Glucosamine inositolphosphorylceramide transferase 1 N-terminal domain-containing protein n=1 Tax=Escherichia albertii TaxID=208962 RepID=A0A5A4U8I9_ESCAL|nr:hypothetical protein [Escherichia albertii]MCZ9036180.1 hypothetical protein [Escherichia albertii]BBM63184.1 predicted protein [Escherichia albertii]
MIIKNYERFCRDSGMILCHMVDVFINNEKVVVLNTASDNIECVYIEVDEYQRGKLKPSRNCIILKYKVVYLNKTTKVFEVARRLININIGSFYRDLALELYFILNFNINSLVPSNELKRLNKSHKLECKRVKKNIFSLFDKVINRFFKRDEWMIAFCKCIIAPEKISSSFEKFNIIPNLKGTFSADPFIIENQGGVYIFYEECSLKRGARGILACYDLAENKRYIILQEPHHLSYPNVFNYMGTYFMIPQSENHSIDLYRATDFPFCWKKERVLLTDKNFNFGDTNIYFSECGSILLTSNIYDHVANSNRIRVGWKIENLLDDKLKIIDCTVLDISDEYSRNAGNSISLDSQIYQECSSTYGGGLVIKKNKKIIYTRLPKGFQGMHTYNTSENFTVIDLKKTKYGFFL